MNNNVGKTKQEIVEGYRPFFDIKEKSVEKPQSEMSNAELYKAHLENLRELVNILSDKNKRDEVEKRVEDGKRFCEIAKYRKMSLHGSHFIYMIDSKIHPDTEKDRAGRINV